MRAASNSTRASRAALAALAAVILVLAVFAGGSALRTSGASARAFSAGKLWDAYERARLALDEQEMLEGKYRLEHAQALHARYGKAAGEFDAALRDAASAGGQDDRALCARLLWLHGRYAAAVVRLFAAVDARDVGQVRRIDHLETDPRFAVVEAAVDAAARTHREIAAQRLRAMHAAQRSVLTATVLVFTAGLLLLSFFTLRLARINRQLALQASDSRHNALHDALTGLPNRVLLVNRVDHALAAARRDPEPFSLLMLDLDRFKEVNDALGHSAGDELLRQIGPRLAPVLRPADTLARMGGDEFALLLPGAGIAHARDVAGRVVAVMREPFGLGEMTVSIDAGVGIAAFPAHGADAETLVRRVEIAMYRAKDDGGGAALYDPAVDPNHPERLQLIHDLRRGIGDDQLELHYQPKYTAEGLRLDGVEALVRWHHPARGLLMPADFIALAEHTGLIRPLTLVVLRKAARQARAWRRDGLDIPVAVNLSVANLLDTELVDDIARILREEQMPADRLELEITETTVMRDPERATELLEQLAAMGIRLSIDDYGTGHSSLAYLRRLPVHTLKIDRSFVQRLATDDEDLKIVCSTIDLGHCLGLRVIAEGVEDAASLELLRRHGCDLVQGYHLGRPVPAESLLAPVAPPVAA